MSAMEENSEESDVESIFEGFEENEVGDDVSDIDVGNISVSDVESSDDELSDDADDGDLNWTDQFDDTFVVNDFREETGPQLPADFDVNTASPLDYFYLFPLTLFVDIVAHTNNYAIWKMAQSGENDPKWLATTLEEMAAYIGLNIFMGIDSKPHYNMYWSTDEFIGNAGFKKTMTCNRYEKLTQYFHVADRQSEPERRSPNYDRLFKIRPIMNTVKETSYKYYKPHREMAIDEGMIKFAGRNSMKQYMPAKPVKRGVKVWMRCESKTSYLTKFNFYLGKSDTPYENGLGHGVVSELTEDIRGKHHHIYFDNFFTSVKLLKDLLKDGIYSCGTVRQNRRNFPDQLKRVKKMQRGDSKIVQSASKRNITAMIWQDKKQVSVLSTLSPPQDILQAGRRIGNARVQLNQPHAVHSYKYMNGVDKHDQYRLKYDVSRESKWWWKYLFFFLVNCAIVNAYILYSLSSKRRTQHTRFTHLDFRRELARALVGGFTSRKRSAMCDIQDVPVADANVRLHRNTHLGKTRRCKVHSKDGKHKETVYGCELCGVHLCKEGCHAKYHNTQ